MTNKVRTAIFGKDLRVEIKKYPLTKAGNKIDINSGGEGYFMPEIGPNQFLEWPIRKRYLFFGPWVYARTFIVVKRGVKCIDFSLDDPKAYGPDIEQLKRANAALLAEKIGQDQQKGTPWYIWFILIMVALTFFLSLQSAGVLT